MSFEICPEQSQLGKVGLTVALSTIIFAELFALFAAAARMPGVYDWLPSADFFHVALVTHVNLAIVIWFLVFSGLLCLISQIIHKDISKRWVALAWAGTIFSTIGTALVVMAPFIGATDPVMANYIPVLDHPIFFIALLLVFAGVMLMMVLPFLANLEQQKAALQHEFAFGMKLTGITFGIAVICLLFAFLQLEPTRTLPYFEVAFWGGGHILQFVNTLAMLSCWILLSQTVFQKQSLPSWSIRALLALILIFALPAPFFFYTFEIQSPEFINAFTFLMRWGLGASTIIIGGMIVFDSFRYPSHISWKDPCYTSLIISIMLFAYGGIIGTLIDYSDVKIPAHYHGVIGAVTLAFMGASYVVLPLFCKGCVQSRLIPWQPILCGVGGILFVTGMFWAGTHGVARKVSGAAQGLDNLGKIAGMSMMGFGGLITLFGVLIFIYVILKSLYQKSNKLYP